MNSDRTIVEPWLLDLAQSMIDLMVRTNRGELSFTFAGEERVRVSRAGRGWVATFPIASDEEDQT